MIVVSNARSPLDKLFKAAKVGSMAATVQLSIVTVDSQRDPPTQFELIRELSPDEYAKYKRADERLSRFTEDQEKLGLLRDTYNDYKSVIDSTARRLEARERPMAVAEVHAQDLRGYYQINGRLRGLLSEITTFLNYAEVYLKREYGHGSEQFKLFKMQTSKEYDASPAYRFVYQLRNYALHYDVPINGMSVEDGDLDPATGVVRKVVRTEIDRDKLLDSSFDWKKVRRDIERFPPRFPLDPHLEHMINAMGRINVAVIVAMLPDMKESARYIHHMIQPLIPRLAGKQGSPAIVHWNPPRDVEVGEQVRMNFSTEMIPAELAKTVLQLPEPDALAAVIDRVGT